MPLRDLRHYVLSRKGRKETIQIPGIVVDVGLFTDFFKKSCAFRRLSKVLNISFRRVEFPVAPRMGINDINDDEIACECMEPCVNLPLLLNSKLLVALPKYLVNLRHSNDDKARVIIHPGYLYVYIS